MRNGSLFRERSNFTRIWLKTSDLEIKVSKSINHLKAHNFVWQWCFFLLLLSCNLDDHLRLNFYRCDILCICWDTPSEKTGLWQLPIVSSAFKQRYDIGPSRHDENSNQNLSVKLFKPKWHRETLLEDTRNKFFFRLPWKRSIKKDWTIE